MGITSVTSTSVAPVTGGDKRGSERAVPAAQATTGAIAGARAPSHEQVAQAIKQVNDDFAQNGQNLYASIEKDKATGINVVKVTDKSTREVVSQFPSKAIIGMAEAISQSQSKKGQMLHVSA